MYSGRDSTFIRNASQGYLNDWRPEEEAAQGEREEMCTLSPDFCFRQLVTDRLTAGDCDVRGRADSVVVKAAQTETKAISRPESIETKARARPIHLKSGLETKASLQYYDTRS